jgi:[NiFe] hydrogenase diaphorase moiety large subunit
VSTPDISTIQPVIREIVQAYNRKATHLMQMLWRVQERYSCIPSAAIECIAQELNLTHAQVQGVASFYSFFHETPRGQYDILVSDNIIEHIQGKQDLMAYMMQKLGVELGQPRADGRVTIANTSCIGMSDQGPAALINGYPLTRLSKTKINKIVDFIESQTPLKEWPQELFQVKNNVQLKHLLLGEHFEPGVALKILMTKGAEATLSEIGKANLRGCGGAGFKTETKWRFCRDTPAAERYVICNADEGEPGTFKDRVIMQDYADVMFEGMTICGGVIGARKGFLYLRGEYRYLLPTLEATLQRRRQQGLLGDKILGNPDLSFDIEIHLGAGAYICGAEMALIESLEGKRGVPWKRPPPFPVTQGYLNKPTVVNNVETLSLAAKLLVYGSERFAQLGTAQSKGTKLLSISGDCDKPGIYEFPFGVTVREVLHACGANETQAVQISGPAGYCIGEAEFDRKLCFEDLNTTGSFMVFNRTRDMLAVVQNYANFFVHESCGFCTPCRVGTSLIANLVEKVSKGNGTKADLNEMANLSKVIKATSNCGLGLTATNHIDDTLKKFPQIYERRLKSTTSVAPDFDLEGALEEARQYAKQPERVAEVA